MSRLASQTLHIVLRGIHRAGTSAGIRRTVYVRSTSGESDTRVPTPVSGSLQRGHAETVRARGAAVLTARPRDKIVGQDVLQRRRQLLASGIFRATKLRAYFVDS